MAAVPAIRSVYAQIRQILGDQISSSEALHFAANVVQFWLRRAKSQSINSAAIERRLLEEKPFETWPVDLAMHDGGWRILEYEIDHFRPDDCDVGRVHVYQTATHFATRVYAAESAPIGDESDRILRSLAWLLADKRLTNSTREHDDPDNDGFLDFDT